MASTQGQSRHHECALCMERFTSPRLLPCFHTFCVGCLQWLVQSQGRSGTFPCPTCRTTVDIPPGGVENFQVNFYIEDEGQVAGSGSKVHTCDMCGKNPASHKCAECDQLACDTCTAVHASIAATRSHTVLQLKNDKGAYSSVLVTKARYCATHTEEKIRFFCNQCSTVICRDCKLTSHEGHTTTDLSAKNSEAKQLILQVTKQLRENLEPKLWQRLRDARDHQNNMQKKKKEILALLEKRAEELKREINKSLSQAKQQLDQDTGSLDTTIAMCIDSMDMELAAFISLTELAERIAKSGCEADILEMPRQMRDFFQDEGEQVSANIAYLPSCVRQPLEVSTAYTTGCKSASKLKSFTSSKWKAVVQMEGDMTRCRNFSCRHEKKLQVCLDCGQASKVQSGYNNYYGNRAGNQQCGRCPMMHDQHLQSCPNRGTAREDVKAAAQRVIPEYIGRVTKTEAEEEDSDEGDCDDPYSRSVKRAKKIHQQQHQQRQPQSYGVQPMHEVTKPKGILANQIRKEIHAIQSCLSGQV